jgi:hypothetical protein
MLIDILYVVILKWFAFKICISYVYYFSNLATLSLSAQDLTQGRNLKNCVRIKCLADSE